MFLKTLTLKGFKSFAESTTLDLERGVTVVVGPNGSGKSNVVDAIAWVLGAQAPTAVRSQKMDDVIFAGAAKRAALGRAEVALTIDNSDGLMPIEFTEVTVTRTLFRTGESEYSINGVPCRLLDIQELLSDTGVGRQQHVVVSQGQIDAVLNARPEERRAIIEEAAGVLKYRKRREKAQRRLQATEANLTRITDLLREVRRQLRPLERQAEAARRHDGLVEELTRLRIYVAGRDIEGFQSRLRAIAARREDLARTDRELRTELAHLDAEVAATEARLSAHGADDVGDALVRLEALRERARGLANVLHERLRAIERERGATFDRDLVASLEADASRLRTDLDAVERDAEALMGEMESLQQAEQDLASARADFERDWAEGVPPPSGKAAEVRGELGAMRAAAERGRSEHGRLEQRRARLSDELESVEREDVGLRDELQVAEQARAPLEGALHAGERRVEQAERAVETAREALAEADSEYNAWRARVDALALALDDARARAGAERLADVAGVVGILLDLVEVDEGWLAPFEAAAGEALSAVVIEGVANARQALATLQDGDVGGAVLALGAAAAPTRTAPAVGDRVRGHVRSVHPGVPELLDALVGGAVVVDGDVSAGIEVVLAHPDAVVVTRDGARLGPTGWRVGQTRAAATGAAHAEAVTACEQAAQHRDGAATRLQTAREHHAAAQAERREASRVLDEHDSHLASLAESLRQVERRREGLAGEVDSLRAQLGELSDRLEREQARVEELEAELPQLEQAEAEQLEQARAMAADRERLDERASAVGSIRTDIEVRAAGLEDRRRFLRQRLHEVEERLARDASQREDAEVRRVDLDHRQDLVDRLRAIVARRLDRIDAELAELRERRRRQSEAAREVAAHLDELRRSRQAAEQRLNEQRELVNRNELEEAETTMRLESAAEALRRDLDCEPEAAVAAEAPPLDEATSPAARIRELERELKLLGPINPLALEEYQALQERHEFLEKQLEDVRSGRRELAKVIRSVDEEIVNVFAAAFADVARNFEALFDTLFPGGKGGLRLTDPENLLDTGVEVEARPSGKNVRKLSLLSGGERSLTALAYLFAVFRSRPSPFYVMDEVEAALDDVNLHRFLGLVDEFRNDAQLIIVSHQKRTMEAADSLYGVTMQPGGSSRVVTERVRSAS